MNAVGSLIRNRQVETGEECHGPYAWAKVHTEWPGEVVNWQGAQEEENQHDQGCRGQSRKEKCSALLSKRVSTLSWVCMHRLGGENISQFEAVAWDRGHCLSIRKKMTPIGGRCAIDMSMKIENRSHGWAILSLRMRHLSSNPLLPYTCDA